MEWTLHRTTQVDSQTGRHDSETTFREKCGFTKDDLDGKMVLDVGVAGAPIARFGEPAEIETREYKVEVGGKLQVDALTEGQRSK